MSTWGRGAAPGKGSEMTFAVFMAVTLVVAAFQMRSNWQAVA